MTPPTPTRTGSDGARAEATNATAVDFYCGDQPPRTFLQGDDAEFERQDAPFRLTARTGAEALVEADAGGYVVTCPLEAQVESSPLKVGNGSLRLLSGESLIGPGPALRRVCVRGGDRLLSDYRWRHKSPQLHACEYATTILQVCRARRSGPIAEDLAHSVIARLEEFAVRDAAARTGVDLSSIAFGSGLTNAYNEKATEAQLAEMTRLIHEQAAGFDVRRDEPFAARVAKVRNNLMSDDKRREGVFLKTTSSDNSIHYEFEGLHRYANGLSWWDGTMLSAGPRTWVDVIIADEPTFHLLPATYVQLTVSGTRMEYTLGPKSRWNGPQLPRLTGYFSFPAAIELRIFEHDLDSPGSSQKPAGIDLLRAVLQRIELTAREQECLGLLLRDLTLDQIGMQLWPDSGEEERQRNASTLKSRVVNKIRAVLNDG